MPSVAGKQEIPKPNMDIPEGFRNLQTHLEKKIRNLEKKKNRLDDYQKRRNNGEELTAQQEEAVSSMATTIASIEFAKELLQQVMDQAKQAKKIEKRQKIEREKQELDMFKRFLSTQSVLDELGIETIKELLRDDSAPIGLKLNEQELQQLDDLYRAITPRREEQSASGDDESPSLESRLQQGAENCINLLEAKDRKLNDNTTYKQASELINRLQKLSYFTANSIPRLSNDDNDEDAAYESDELNEVNNEQPINDNEPEIINEPQQKYETNVNAAPVVEPKQLQQQPQPQQQQQQQQQQPPQPPTQTLEQQQWTLNDIKQQYKGQFDFVLESEVEPAVVEQQATNWNPAPAPAKADWAEEAAAADNEQAPAWQNPQSRSLLNQAPTQQQQSSASIESNTNVAATADTTAVNTRPNASDVFSSATQSAYLKAADGNNQENDASGFVTPNRGRGGAGGGGGVGGGGGGGRGGRGFNTNGGGFRGGRGGQNQRGRPPYSGGGGGERRGGGGSNYRGGGGGGGGGGWQNRGGDDAGYGGGARGYGGGRGGGGGGDRGGNSSYSRPRAAANVFKNSNAQ